MGYAGYTRWDSGLEWTIQSLLSITLDDVTCSSGEWSSCSYTLSHNCDHSEDVFLQCYEHGKSTASVKYDNFFVLSMKVFIAKGTQVNDIIIFTTPSVPQEIEMTTVSVLDLACSV